MKIVIKKADKGSIITIMSPESYWNMCQKHLDNNEHYENIPYNPKDILQKRIDDFIEKYKETFLNKEYQYLKNYNYKIANFYMLPKLHKCKRLNEIISENPMEYLSINEDLDIEGRPIVAGSAYNTHGISILIHKIMESSLKHISHILQDTFDFVERAEKKLKIGTVLGVADIKSLYTNISHELGLKALEYWIEKLKDQLEYLQRFSKNFILEGMSIILKYNYFYINNNFIHQIKGTAMGTHAAVVYANLTCGYLEAQLFMKLPEIYSMEIVEFFLRNYFRFLDDGKCKWKESIDVTLLWELMNSLDPDIKFIFEKLSTLVNFLDVSYSIKDDYLIFDIYHKPTHSFSYLHYRSCHPRHTKNNTALSLGQRIIRIVSDNKETYLNKLKSCLIQRGHPEEVLNFTMSKLFSPTVKNQDESIDIVTFIHTYNPNVKFNKNIINERLNNFSDRSLKDTFLNKKPLVATRQGKNLQTLLTKV